MRADAGVDEEAKVEAKQQTGDHRRAEDLAPGIGVRGLAHVVRLQVALAVVRAVVAVRLVPLRRIQGHVGAQDAARDAGDEPDDEAHADVGAGVDAGLELARCSRDDFGNAPYQGEASLYQSVYTQISERNCEGDVQQEYQQGHR